MQEDLQRMESHARRTDATEQPGHQRITSMSATVETVLPENSEYKPFQNTTPIEKMSLQADSAPSFSPFPKVKGDNNIPPSDEAKEEILCNARQHVLHSNNVSMQLSWARDALAYVETASEAFARENPDAQRSQTPKIEHELRVDAINIVNYLASQDHPEALFMRSKWMEFGKFGRRVDKKEAYLGYKRAAEQGWGRAEYRMGMLYENSNEVEKAVIHYNKGLDLNDSAGAYRLGMMHLLGQHGYRKDYQRGVDLVRQSAETADEDAPQGAYVFGMLIARDLPDVEVPEDIVPWDPLTAKLYIEKAAYLGFSKAQLKMGQAYELCQLGCDFNPSYSLHYYGLAAKQGNAEAALGVSRWFLFGYEGHFSKNEQLAFQYAQQSANDKKATGYFAMGYFYEIGIHVEKDLELARRWYEKAAENGNGDARKRIESLDGNKSFSKEDHETKALDRIKSKHGSMRGKRPDRFARQNQVMPTLNEGEGRPGTSPNLGPMRSPGHSPGQSPRQYPHDTAEFPDPERMPMKPPAFGLNVAGPQKFPIRSSSAAPYPEDGRPAPLKVKRSPSNAPYPEDDVQGGARPGNYGSGPRADQPKSGFGIRPGNSKNGGRPGYGLIPPAGTSPGRVGRGGASGRGMPPSNVGRNNGQGHGGYPPNHGRGGPPPKNRPPQGQYPPGGYGPGPGPQGPDYSVGPRTSSLNVGPGLGSGPPEDYARHGPGRPDQGGGMPPRMDNMGPPGGPGGPVGAWRPSPSPGPTGPGGQPHANLKEGRQSAPPEQAQGARRPSPSQRPTMPPSQNSSTAATTQGASAKQSQGPATFDEMGIKPGKDKDDCVSNL